MREVLSEQSVMDSVKKACGKHQDTFVATLMEVYVQDGKLLRNASVRLVRDGIVIHEGQLASLKRFKDDVKEVASGFECGLSIEKFNDIKEGDVVEAYTMEQIQL